MTTLTKTGIEFDSFHVWRETRLEAVDAAPQEVTTWYISVGYRVTTAEGESWQRDITEELTGSIKTKASSLLTSIRNVILQKEGLSP